MPRKRLDCRIAERQREIFAIESDELDLMLIDRDRMLHACVADPQPLLDDEMEGEVR